MTKTVARLYEQFHPEHYQLEILPNADTMTFSGRVVITGRKVGRPSQRLTFHQNKLKITDAKVTFHDKKGDVEVPLNRTNLHNGLLEVRLHSEKMMYPGNYTVELGFEGTITTGMTGIYPCFFTHEDKKYTMIMTQFESHFARDAFPCIDEPEAKATFDLTVKAPKHQTALGNTPVKHVQELDDGQLVTFETSPKMSTYLLAFVIGDIHSKHTTTKSGVEVGVWGTIAQPKESFDFALEVAKGSIEFFEDYFDTPYPLKKADHVAVPDFSVGAMENWGLITYREIALLLYPDQASQSTKELISTVVAHETSHQWFGNLVTMRWWNDLWLNESFANMMEYRAVDAIFPEWKIWDTFYGQEGLSALRRDSTHGVQAIQTEVHHPDEINTLFDPSIVYAKGGRLLYMLKDHIGEEAFRKGLSAYFKKHAFSNTEGKDLWHELSEASHKDIAAFMNPWLDRSGFPVVSVDQVDTHLTLKQEHFLDTPEKAENDRLWPVPLFANRTDVPEVLSKSHQVVKLDDSDYVFLNQEGAGHYLVSYTQPAHREAITNMVKEDKLSEIDRLMLLSTSSMLARAGYSTFAETLVLLEAYGKESADPVWDIMSVVLGDARRFIDIDESVEKSIKQLSASLITDQYSRLGWEEHHSESAADKKLRATIIGLGSYADVPEVVKEALERFEKYKSDPSTLATELRGIVFVVAVKHRVPGVIDYLLDLHNSTPNSDLKRDVTAALTATKDHKEAERYLELLKQPDIVKPQDADRWLFMMLRNRHLREQSWQWMEDNWGWVETTYADDKTYDYFPRYASSVCNTPEWEKRFNDFFAPKLDQLILKRNILIGQEEIAARIKWLDRDWPAVKKYFGIQ